MKDRIDVITFVDRGIKIDDLLHLFSKFLKLQDDAHFSHVNMSTKVFQAFQQIVFHSRLHNKPVPTHYSHLHTKYIAMSSYHRERGVPLFQPKNDEIQSGPPTVDCATKTGKIETTPSSSWSFMT